MGALRSESPFSYFHCSTCASTTASYWKRHTKRIPKVCSKWMNLIFDSWCISMERSVAQKVIKGKKNCHMCLQNFFLITHKLKKWDVPIWGVKSQILEIVWENKTSIENHSKMDHSLFYTLLFRPQSEKWLLMRKSFLGCFAGMPLNWDDALMHFSALCCDHNFPMVPMVSSINVIHLQRTFKSLSTRLRENKMVCQSSISTERKVWAWTP